MHSTQETFRYSQIQVFTESKQNASLAKTPVPGPQIFSLTIGRLLHRMFFGRANAVLHTLGRATSSEAVWGQGRLRLSYMQLTIAFVVITSFVSVSLVQFITHKPLIDVTYASTASLSTSSTSVVALLDSQTQEAIAAAYQDFFATYHPEVVDAATLTARSAMLARYLQERHSPLIEFASVIAQQSHWKLILAISFAESGMGKRCADNNCSGIGVEPGHPKWQMYETKGDWAKALNRLLEKRYKDKTLQQMCGVYVQPCNENWLLATNQILKELKVWQIP